MYKMTVDYSLDAASSEECASALMEVFPEENVDAYRIGFAHSKKSMEKYDTFVSCGCTDIGEEVNSVLYMFGGNYGH